MTDSRL